MKRIITWLYRKFVGEIFIPEYSTFAIGMKCESAGAKIWNSYLPDILSLKVKTLKGWQDVVLERK